MESTRKEHPNIFRNPDGMEAHPEDFYFNRCIFVIRKVLTTFGIYVQPLDSDEDLAEAGDKRQKKVMRPNSVPDECGGLFVTAPTPMQRGNYMNVIFYFII